MTAMPKLTAIACMSRNRVIGDCGRIPWHFPEDLRFFRAMTMGGTVVMGRRTWESLPNGALKGRSNLVLSRNLPANGAPAAQVVRSPDQLKWIGIPSDEKVFVIGGAEIYRLLMPWTTEVLLTVLDAEHEGDTFMPEFEGEFGEPGIIHRVDGVGEWMRYVRKSE